MGAPRLMKVKPRVLRVGLEMVVKGIQEWLPELNPKIRVDQAVEMYVVRAIGDLGIAIELLRDLEKSRKESQNACYSGK